MKELKVSEIDQEAIQNYVHDWRNVKKLDWMKEWKIWINEGGKKPFEFDPKRSKNYTSFLMECNASTNYRGKNPIRMEAHHTKIRTMC